MEVSQQLKLSFSECSFFRMVRNGLIITLPDSDSDSKPNGYIVPCRRCSHCTDSDSDHYSVFLFKSAPTAESANVIYIILKFQYLEYPTIMVKFLITLKIKKLVFCVFYVFNLRSFLFRYVLGNAAVLNAPRRYF